MRIILLISLLFAVVIMTVCCGKSTDSNSQPTEKTIDRLTFPNNRLIPYEMGTASFVISNYFGGYVIVSEIEIFDPEFQDKIDGTGTLILDENWVPKSYTRLSYLEFGKDRNVKGDSSIEGVFSDGMAKLGFKTPDNPGKQQKSFDIPDSFFIFDNNYIGQMAFICSQPTLKSGRQENLILLALQQKAILAITMTPKIKVRMDFNGGKIIAYEVDMKANGVTFGRYFITPDGVLIRAIEDSGRMTINLVTDYKKQSTSQTG
jgi:hypothetical protein